MAELADALDSGSSEGNFMQVQVLFPAPERPSLDGLFLKKENHQLSWWRLKLKQYTKILLCYIEKDLAVAQCNDRRIYHYEK